ncbi:hypothetical protein ACFQXB_12825 [Plastorhodobacter daqingensis]|uniref:Hedgehog/Intein (Hint) domain-containing protein n=1 Tax=Plastorhodobacter daqingensis TaxID=1387281 RepID=A0ABW2UK53_9RHOB
MTVGADMKLDFKPFPLANPLRGRIERLAGGRLQAIRSQPCGAAGRCYWNADAAAEASGAAVVHGWLVSIWPHHLVEILHHAVIAQPDGTLLDVTPYYRETERVTFIVDDSIVPPRDYPAYIPSKFMILGNSALGRAFRDGAWRQNEISRALAERARAAGIPLVLGERLALPRSPEVRALWAALARTQQDLALTVEAMRQGGAGRRPEPRVAPRQGTRAAAG